jgi:uncharacterized protein (DUF736 family)
MPEPATAYVSYGCLWAHPNGDDFQGKIYDVPVVIHRNPEKSDGDNFPAWHIASPEDGAKMGGLWVNYGKKDGTEYLSGKITIAGVERRVGLWPANRKSDKSPHWRVMPPSDQAPPVEAPSSSVEAPPPQDPAPPPANPRNCSCVEDMCGDPGCQGAPF